MPDNKQCIFGNGKKKGACSGNNNNVIDINQYRWWRSGQQLRRKVAEFADSEIFVAEMEIARELYFSVMEPELVDEKDDFLMERFFEWFIFDYRIRRKSILDYLAMTKGLTGEERTLLEKWKRARSSVYRVLEAGNDNRIDLLDIIRNKTVRVLDRQAACEIEPDQILYIRVLPMGGINEFSTGGLILPGYFDNYLLNRIKMDAELFWSTKNRRGSWDIYLRERAHMLNAMIMEMGILWELPEGRTDHQINALNSEMTGEHLDRLLEDDFWGYFCDRWINEPMDLLMGKTPLEAYRTKSGREKLQKLIHKIEILRDADFRIPVDLSGLWKRLDSEHDLSTVNRPNHSDVDNNGDGGVSKLIRDGLHKMGYRPQQVRSAVAMWQQYKDLARPTFRKPGVWAAAVIYALVKSQGNNGVNRNDLAQMFNVSASTISNKYSSIRRTLHLDGN